MDERRIRICHKRCLQENYASKRNNEHTVDPHLVSKYGGRRAGGIGPEMYKSWLCLCVTLLQPLPQCNSRRKKRLNMLNIFFR